MGGARTCRWADGCERAHACALKPWVDPTPDESHFCFARCFLRCGSAASSLSALCASRVYAATVRRRWGVPALQRSLQAVRPTPSPASPAAHLKVALRCRPLQGRVLQVP